MTMSTPTPRYGLTLVLVLGATLGLACQSTPTDSPSPSSSGAPSKTASSSPAPEAARAAPNLAVETFNAGKFDLSAHRGKVVVVNFWATWCPPCVAEMPGFDATYRRLKGDGLEIVGLSVDQEGPKVVREFLAKRQISYPIGMADSTTAARFGIGNSIPYTVFIDRRGNIRDTVTGGINEGIFERKVKKLLQEPAS
ncbi:TlpA disulfide reductase family protein [Chloracidobacterium aggregatum]|jgi:thiol-disulfide isomerase/thioredoxin|nr:TlpA disulfide reductase family protein [Chloracidobacterium aggregatum]QUV85596.1 TlpA family protein disulfide reductase [Chloracidobacterium sp. 2]QUW00178.1 TlpA family protein disulfide reductase [Chloracidobacterium sp. MS 40/45]